MKTMTPRLIFAGLIAALMMAAPVQAQTLQPLDRIAAVVNEDVVLQSELDRAVNNITALTDLYGSFLGKPVIKAASTVYALKLTAQQFFTKKTARKQVVPTKQADAKTRAKAPTK